MGTREFKHTVTIDELWLSERRTKPPYEGVDLQLAMMGSTQAFQVLESALRDQLQQFGRFGKATRLFRLSVPWKYRSEWTEDYLNSLHFNNRRMRFSWFRTLKVRVDREADQLELNRIGDKISLRMNEDVFESLVDGVAHRSGGSVTGIWCFEDVTEPSISFALPPLGDWFEAE